MALLAAGVATVQADYTLNVLTDGVPRARVTPGETFELGVFLSTAAEDTHDAAVFQLSFSSEGLLLNSYTWAAPYQTGTLEDASTPSPSLLPVLITPQLLSGGSYPFNVTDIEFSNITPQAGQFFNDGRLVTLSISVPANYSGPDSVTITPVPVEFVKGFGLVTTVPGQSFVLTIPEPSTLAFGISGLLLLMAGSARRKIGPNSLPTPNQSSTVPTA